jgi:hypothetical protein
MNKQTKEFTAMTPEQLLEQTKGFDAGSIPAGRPLSSTARAKWEKARAGGSASLHLGPGRPKVGEGAVHVPVSVEAGLLRRSITKAAALGLKRSEYFAKALQLLTDGRAEIGGRTVTAARGDSGSPSASKSGRIAAKKKVRTAG